MYSLWPVNITTACCSAEFGAASGARHDLERFGVLPIGSLRQSDLIVIEGTITKKMAKRLRMIYDQMALPRYVIAMGDCPVDVYVPGCPPRPEALEQAIIMLQEKIRRSKVYEQG
ncbi:NADH-quinone oxidoreductase subunit B [Candidatus Bathyarchaeota archaeon]|nr:MAG: NADH-quinone oxidoreductase subunit B [Candidatus Bathyarchaeota archaeon]